ncbi:MAG: sigma-70 family RNA polymerase sigma factor [Anaerolineales bacterium]|nr:sigma-70 family RNA polymerase sigma factor [Anaerolineales bacterium]
MDRTNEQWITDLRSSGSEQDAALEDLRGKIRKGLPYSLSKWLTPSDPNFDSLADEVVQETLLRVLDHLESFEGRSKFTTWAHKIAIRIALTELRRKRWEDVSLDEMVEGDDGSSGLDRFAAMTTNPDLSAEQADFMARIQQVIKDDLSEKQRTALLAIGVQGMPIEEVARRMNMKSNALYKLLHDARLKLKKSMVTEGFSTEELLAAFEQE